MAYDLTGYRDDWLKHAYSRYVYPTLRPAAVVESVVPHDFVGAQPGYFGELTQHGELCRRNTVAPDGHGDQTMLRHFAASQSKDDAAAVDISGAVILNETVNGQYCGIMAKVPDTGHAEGTVVCPDPATLNDGDNVAISDGTTSVTFWVDKTGTYPGPPYDATNIRWLVQGLSTAVQVADALRTLIRTTFEAGTFNMTTDAPGDATVVVINRDIDVGSASGFVTNEPITSVGPFTTTGMSGGGNTIGTAQGYAVWIQPGQTNSILLGSCYYAMTSQNPLYSNTASDINLKEWVGLRLTAHRIGDSMRIRVYYMAGASKVDAMYTNPQWTQVFDALHISGDVTAYPGSSIPGQTVSGRSWNTTTPSYTGRAGFFNLSGGGAVPIAYFAGMRIVRGAVL
jgi:hypothetical protein